MTRTSRELTKLLLSLQEKNSARNPQPLLKLSSCLKIWICMPPNRNSRILYECFTFMSYFMLFHDIFFKLVKLVHAVFSQISRHSVLTNPCIISNIIILQICNKRIELRSECEYENATYNLVWLCYCHNLVKNNI